MRILNYFRMMFRKHQVSMSLLTLQVQLKTIQRDKERSDKELADRQKAWVKLREWYDAELQRNAETLTRVNETNRKMEIALADAHEHIKTLEEIQIPGLVAANAVFVQRWEAEAAVHVMRQVALKKEPAVE